MPYIEPARRKPLLEGAAFDSIGEFNYIISQEMDKYLMSYGLNYTNINALIGVLECAKLELYRRVAAQYEDTKIKENGDVYSGELTHG